MQFNDLAEQYQILKPELDSQIQRVLNHGHYIMGPEVLELERRLAEYAVVKHVISCSNGTDALVLPLMAWNISRGDAVFTTPFTFFATAEVISILGATPVFVDINQDTYNIDPDLLEKTIERIIQEGKLKPKVIIPVDLFGLPADYDSIEAIAKKFNLKLLEDAAQGFGSIYKERVAGSFGDAAATSFFPAKPLGCYGDGGAIFTNDDELATILRSLRVHGQGFDKYENIRIGINSRLDTLQAAILLSKLTVFKDEIALRNQIAEKYTEGLRDILKTPAVPKGYISTWAQYSVLAKDNATRNMLQSKLKEFDIPTAIYYRIPLHLQKVYKELDYKKGDFPISEDTSERILSLPMHPYMKDEDIKKIVEVIKLVV